MFFVADHFFLVFMVPNEEHIINKGDNNIKRYSFIEFDATEITDFFFFNLK